MPGGTGEIAPPKDPANKPNYTGYITSDLQLLQIVDTALDAAAQRAGAHLACYPGCAVCCFGPFPITQTDATRLRTGFATFATNEPNTAAAIAQRAEAARTRLADSYPNEAFPGDPATGHLSDTLDEAAFAARFSDLACPALDPDSGHCLLHESRPIACRLYGLPSRVSVNGEASHSHPHCPLCFKRASEAEIETSRAIIDLRNWDLPNCETSPSDSEPPRTLVAYALGFRSIQS